MTFLIIYDMKYVESVPDVTAIDPSPPQATCFQLVPPANVVTGGSTDCCIVS